jgi:hypothetical protein
MFSVLHLVLAVNDALPKNADEAMKSVVMVLQELTLDLVRVVIKRRYWESIAHSICYGRSVP